MVCIVCLATLAAIGFTTAVAIDQWLDERLGPIAENGTLLKETESVATWRGEFRVILDDGAEKLVAATLHIFKDSGRVRITLDDHSLTEQEAARLEDEILEALDAELIERRYPSDGPFPEGLEHEHEHADDEPEPEEAEPAEVEVEADAETRAPERR